jgi:phospholipid/cholesterol/gamma-HCH transport system substrate-binding protein
MAVAHSRELKVGALILAALAVLATGLLVLGDRSNLFVRKNAYLVRFSAVGGLAAGSAVTLDGVNVGNVDRVVLPESPRRTEIDVWLKVDHRYARRLRSPADTAAAATAQATKARLMTQGLLGDKYIELSSGPEAFPMIPDGGEIPAAAPTNLEHLVASGEDVMENVTQLSRSLVNILSRMDRGEGLLGELTTESPSGREIRESAIGTLRTLQQVAADLEHGHGLLPRLINDPGLAQRLSGAVDHLSVAASSLTAGAGPLPALLNDPAERAKVDDTLANLNRASRDLEELAGRLDKGQGLLPKLVEDQDYARQVSERLSRVVDRLDTLSGRLVEGQGTAARLINDPGIYDAINDVIVGVDQSWMLRWLIRNRQKAGIKKRYHDAAGGEADPAEKPAAPKMETSPPPPAPPATPIPPSPPPRS